MGYLYFGVKELHLAGYTATNLVLQSPAFVCDHTYSLQAIMLQKHSLANLNALTVFKEGQVASCLLPSLQVFPLAMQGF